jgi:hypothetical protein
VTRVDAHEQRYDDYEEFECRLAGEATEDLAGVFKHVRLQATAETRAQWARRRTTRQFCDLGLHLLYLRHFRGTSSVEAHSRGEIFPSLRPEYIANHADSVVRDPKVADELTRQRWADTWGHQSNYVKDLIAYLFRPGPYVVRIRESQLHLRKMLGQRMPLGELVRTGVRAEIESNLRDPLAALQTFVQTALPTRPEIQEHARRLDEETIRLWARLYRVIFPAYGLELRGELRWSDLARTFTAVADGVLVRARIRDSDDLERLSNGDDVLSAVIIGLLPSVFQIGADEIEQRELQQLPPDDLV